MSLSDLFDSFTLFIQYIEKIKLPIQSWLSCHENPWVPFTHPYLGPWLVPSSPGNLLPASYHSPADSTADSEAILAEATSRLHSRFGFSSSTLQVEQYQPEMAQCLRCREPPQA